MEYLPFTLTSVTQSGTSATIYFQRDNIKHVLLGARGTFNVDLTVKTLPKLKFTFTGLLGTISNNALNLTGLVYNAHAPIAVSTANTDINLFGYVPVVESFSFDVANDVKFRALVGSESVTISDRKPKGNIKFECPESLVTKNFFSLAENSTLGTLDVTHGVTAGNIVNIQSIYTGIDAPKYADNEGVVMLDCGLTFVPSSTGNDEITLTFV